MNEWWYVRELHLFLFLSDIYIVSRTETEISDSYSLLMENLYHVSSALTALELQHKGNNSASSPSIVQSSGSGIKDTVDIITTL